MRKETKLIRVDIDNIKLLDQVRGKLSYNQFITTMLIDYKTMRDRLVDYEKLSECLYRNSAHSYKYSFEPTVKKLCQYFENKGKQ